MWRWRCDDGAVNADEGPHAVRCAYERATAGDPTAMVRLGGYLAGTADMAGARQWFATARAAGSAAAAHLLAALPDDAHAGPAGTGGLVSTGVLGPQQPPGSGWFTDPGFLVVSPEIELAAQAVHRAGERFMYVAEDGRILDDWELPWTDRYTPNWVSPVHLTEPGPALWADTKGELSRAMGQAMVNVLVEELRRAEVTAFVTQLPHALLAGSTIWTAPQPDPPRQIADADRAWFIQRSVAKVLRDGRGYREPQYWTADGRWTGDRAEAQQFTEPPTELVVRLRAQRRPEDSEPTGVFLPVAPGEDDWPMPLPTYAKSDDGLDPADRREHKLEFAVDREDR
jgi:hypothetical protein